VTKKWQIRRAEKALRCILKCYGLCTVGREHYSAFLKKLCDRSPDLVLRMLEDDDWTIRSTVIDLLAKRADENSVETLIQALNRKHPDRRLIIANLIARKIKDERAVEALIKALEDEQTEVRERAAKALGELGDKRAVEPLIQALKGQIEKPHETNDRSRRDEAEVLKEIIGALNKLGPDERVLVLLLEIWQAALFQDLSRGAEKEAIHNLNEIFAKISGKISEKSIEQLLQFCMKNIREQPYITFSPIGYAINSLFSIGTEKAIQALIQIYEESKKAKAKEIKDFVGEKLEELGRRPKSWSDKIFGR